MELLIVTGMSGAGKSQAANALEDMGYYCVDNIPPAIIPSLCELYARGNSQLGKMAVVTDARGGNMFEEISDVLKNLKNNNIFYKILFLDAADDVLVRRYKENRRKHPLCDSDDITLVDAVRTERKMLSHIRADADYIVDTGKISSAQLKEQLYKIFFGTGKSGLNIICKSFGFKYGMDIEADLVFDARCLPNPYYVDSLRSKTGIDKDVSDYVFASEQSQEFVKRLFDFIDYSVPLYIKEGKSQLNISIGCTGGKHRSVAIAELLNKHLGQGGYSAGVLHRDMYKG